MKNLYVANRLMQYYGVVPQSPDRHFLYEPYYQKLMSDSNSLLQHKLIKLPIIEDWDSLIGYYNRQWKIVQEITDDLYIRCLVQFTLTRLFCQRYKRENKPELISILASSLSTCIESSEPLGWKDALILGLFILAGYELFVLCKEIYAKTFMQ